MTQVASDSLLWIKNELDSTLLRARQALEAYAEHQDDTAAIEACLEFLHQVQGTLRIVEVYGAAMLAEEMESVARALSKDEIGQRDDALEVLMRAMLQLPDYLERVVGGRRDMPLALLSLLNDLRSVRGQPLLSESALFAHNLSGRVATTLDKPLPAHGTDIAALARKLRPRFQASLLAFYKGADADKHLQALADIAEQLEQAATTPPVFELWWIVGGVIEAMADGGLEASVSLKQMLGQIDRQIKRLSDEGEAPVAEDPPRELVNNLLYYVGKASSNGERVSAIKESFKLGQLLPDEGTVEETRASMAGPNASLMRTVSAAVKDDLARVKDSLDIFVRMGKSNPGELEPQVEMLKKVGDTLAVLGLGALRTDLETQRAALQAIVEGNAPADEAPLMDIAGVLISLESGLDEAMVGLISSGDNPRAENAEDSEDAIRTRALDDPEYKQVFNAVIRESIINLARAKEAIIEFVNDAGKPDDLKPVPGFIREIQAGLRLLDLERPAALLESLHHYIRRKIFDGNKLPAQNELDRMADAIVSIEFYLETVQQGRGNPVSMLDNAEACVAALGFPVGQEYPEEFEEDEARESAFEEVVLEGAGEIEVAEAEESPTLEGFEVSEEPVEAATAEVPAPAPEPVAELPPVMPRPEDVDPEIVEIFLEEAQEEISSLGENVPRWKANPQDADALGTVRRSFHTLKGSGRMVGALLIGEFAWAFENLLNRVIDQTIPADDAMFGLIEQALAALPQLVEQLESGLTPQADIRALMTGADAMSRGEQAAPAEPAAQAEPEAAAPAEFSVEDLEETVLAPGIEVLEAAEPGAGGMDPLLYEIFSRETEGHLQVLDGFLADPVGVGISEDVLRASHTLNGSSSLAGANELAALAEPVERFLRTCAEHGRSVGTGECELLGEFVAAARQLVQAYGEPEGELPDTGELQSRLHATLDELSRKPAEATAAPAPAPETPSAEPRMAPAPVEAKYVELSSLENYDPELAGIFFEEANELLEATDTALHSWQQDRDQPALVAELNRHLHTLKGGARMAGITPMGDLSHELETLLTLVVDGRLAVSTSLVFLLQRAVDRLHKMLEQGYAGKAVIDAQDLIDELRQVTGYKSEDLPDEPGEAFSSVPAEPEPVAPEAEESASAAEFRAVAGTAADRRGGSRIQHEMLRVRADLLEAALNHAGEVSIYRARLEQQINSMNFNLVELDQTVTRLREQLRNLEIETEAQILYQWEQEGGDTHDDFDPLEMDRYSTLQQLSRALAESVGDLTSIQALLSNLARESETLLLQQSRVTTELQDGLMRTRMVPFSNHAQRLRRIVRQTAEECGHRAELSLIGAEGEMDRQVLERIVAPLEHMLRNAVVHGIEKPAERARAGKPEVGTITIGLQREGSEVVIEVIDDGSGLNLDAIRDKAVSLGMIKSGATVPEADLMQFIMEPGFSTAQELTQSAGRGVGMDVVYSEIKQLGGSLVIDSSQGAGTRFTVRLPFTLAITQALLVTVAEETYAIPLPSIEGIARIPRERLLETLKEDNPVYNYGGRDYRLQHLGVLLGMGAPELPDDIGSIPVLLVRTAGHQSALITEGMQGSREIVVKSVGPQVSNIRGISGATILGDGSILLILDVAGLIRIAPQQIAELEESVEREGPKEDERTFAMVVDDSITVRRVTQRLLERYGMRVLTAKDGIDALALLQENIPDVMLLDIEMPRMDGYELATHMRNDDRFKEIPIIMITSRTGEKHRNRAMDIGVNTYLGKPYQEAELLEHIGQLVGKFNPERTRWD